MHIARYDIYMTFVRLGRVIKQDVLQAKRTHSAERPTHGSLTRFSRNRQLYTAATIRCRRTLEIQKRRVESVIPPLPRSVTYIRFCCLGYTLFACSLTVGSYVKI